MLASLGVELSLKKIIATLLSMRTHRWGLVQTEFQLKFSVDAIIEGLKDIETVACDAGQVNGKRLADVVEDDNDNDDDHPSRKRRKNSSSSTS